MKAIICFIGIVLGNILCYAQWSAIATDSENPFCSVFFPTSNVGYVSGRLGEILKTTDAGNSWFKLTGFTTEDINSIVFTDVNTGYALTNNTLYKTTNGGSNWSNSSNGLQGVIRSLCFTDSNTGYIVGHPPAPAPPPYYTSVFKTTNAGANWIGIDGTGYRLLSVCFPDKNTGYAVGGEYNDCVFLKTTNGGNNWYAPATELNKELKSIYFTDINVGYVIGFAGIYKTTNGGINWFNSSNGASGANSIYFINSDVGYVVGGPGEISTIFKTTNGGSSWILQQHPHGPFSSKLNSVYFTDINNGYAVGTIYSNSWPSSHCVLKTTNGGAWISDYDKVTQISIYPNPAKEKIIVDLKGLDVHSDAKVIIYNTFGQVLIQHSITQKETEFDISLLPCGIYIVKAELKEGIGVEKFVKE